MSRRKKPRPEHAFIIHRQALWGRPKWGGAMQPGAKTPSSNFHKVGEVVWVLAVKKDKVGEWEYEEADALDPDKGVAIRQATKNLTGKPHQKRRTDSRDILHKVFIGKLPPYPGTQHREAIMRQAEIHKGWLERFSGWPF